MEIYNNNNSVFVMYYHLIMTVKYRHKIIDDEINLFLRNKFEQISPKYMIDLEEFNHEQDHIHVLLRAHPNTSLLKFINAYKSASSRMVKKYFPEIKFKL